MAAPQGAHHEVVSNKGNLPRSGDPLAASAPPSATPKQDKPEQVARPCRRQPRQQANKGQSSTWHSHARIVAGRRNEPEHLHTPRAAPQTAKQKPWGKLGVEGEGSCWDFGCITCPYYMCVDLRVLRFLSAVGSGMGCRGVRRGL